MEKIKIVLFILIYALALMVLSLVRSSLDAYFAIRAIEACNSSGIKFDIKGMELGKGWKCN